MHTRVLGLAASAFILACGAVGAIAQDQVTPQQPTPDQHQMQSSPMDQPMDQPIDRPMRQPMGQAMGRDEDGTTGQGRASPEGMPGGGMMDRGTMRGGMMGRGMMAGGMRGCSPIMSRIIFALMDADGDGTVSLQEFEAAHARIFKAMDANKDGQLTEDEMMAFMRGMPRSAPQQ